MSSPRRYQSPPGTYEMIRKSVLEDHTLSDAAYRLACSLATKPDDWVIHPEQVAREMGKSLRWWVMPGLRELRQRGLVKVTDQRDAAGRVRRRQTALCRDQVVASPQVSTPMTTGVSGAVTRPNAEKPQVSTPMTDHDSVVNRRPREDVPVASTDSLSEDVSQVPASPLRGDAGPYTPTDIRAAVAARFIDLDDDDLDTITAVLCDRQAANRIAHLDRYVGALSEITINYWLATYEPEETTP